MDVDVWSDVTCPWCAFGKRSLDDALAVFEHRDDVTVIWHAFELEPGAPRSREHGGNTFDAHRLVKFAATQGKAEPMMARLMRAHAEGEPVGDREVLARLAGEVGLDVAAARVALASGRHAAEVREDERSAAKLGIAAVPYYVLARRFGISGAQSTEGMLEGLRRAYTAA